MKALRKLSVWAILLLAVDAAQATPAAWTDIVSFNPSVYLTQGAGGFSYQHDIKTEGFNPLIDTVSGYILGVDLDSASGNNMFLALVTPASPGNSFFDVSGVALGGWSLTGDAVLQSTGLLTVTIESLVGSFYIVSSSLVAYGTAPDVPEPDTFGLSAVGLMGVALAMRRMRRLRAAPCRA